MIYIQLFTGHIMTMIGFVTFSPLLEMINGTKRCPSNKVDPTYVVVKHPVNYCILFKLVLPDAKELGGI